MDASPIKWVLLLIAWPLIFFAACNEDVPSAHNATPEIDGFQSYSRDGLSFDYPAHWALEHDDPPGPYSDWTLVFDVSKLSWFWIHIYFESGKSLEQFVDYFVQVLKLDEKAYVENYRRMPVTVGKYSGMKLSWTDSRPFPVSIDMRIFRIETASGSVFAVVDLAEEDFDREWPRVLPILDSLEYAQQPSEK